MKEIKTGLSEVDKMLWRIITLTKVENQYYESDKLWIVKVYNDKCYLHYNVVQRVGVLQIQFMILGTMHNPNKFGYWNE